MTLPRRVTFVKTSSSESSESEDRQEVSSSTWLFFGGEGEIFRVVGSFEVGLAFFTSRLVSMSNVSLSLPEFV